MLQRSLPSPCRKYINMHWPLDTHPFTTEGADVFPDLVATRAGEKYPITAPMRRLETCDRQGQASMAVSSGVLV